MYALDNDHKADNYRSNQNTELLLLLSYFMSLCMLCSCSNSVPVSREIRYISALHNGGCYVVTVDGRRQ